MAISPVVTDISELAVGDYVVGFEDMSGHSKQYASKASGTYTVLFNAVDLPTVKEVNPIEYTDPVSGDVEIGGYVLILTPTQYDNVNGSTGWVSTVDANCQVLTNATAN
jgi:hypothetical protein